MTRPWRRRVQLLSRLRLRASTPSLPASSHIRMSSALILCITRLLSTRSDFENSRMCTCVATQASRGGPGGGRFCAGRRSRSARARPSNPSNFLENLKAQNELMQIFKSERKRVVCLARHQPSVELALPLRAQIRRYRLKTYSAERDFAAWRVRRRCLVAWCRAVQFELRAGRALPCASRALVALSPITIVHT